MRKRRRRRRRPHHLIYLDEIDVIQMAFDAGREYPQENFGLIAGVKTKRGPIRIYKVHFVFVIPNTKRTKASVCSNEEALLSFKKCYRFEVLGDFHSHPGGEKDSNEPSQEDLKDSIKDYGEEAVIAVIHVGCLDFFRLNKENGGGHFIPFEPKVRGGKIVCWVDFPKKGTKKIFNCLRVSIEFFTFKSGVSKIPMNKNTSALIENIYPRLVERKHIHKKSR